MYTHCTIQRLWSSIAFREESVGSELLPFSCVFSPLVPPSTSLHLFSLRPSAVLQRLPPPQREDGLPQGRGDPLRIPPSSLSSSVPFVIFGRVFDTLVCLGRAGVGGEGWPNGEGWKGDGGWGGRRSVGGKGVQGRFGVVGWSDRLNGGLGCPRSGGQRPVTCGPS